MFWSLCSALAETCNVSNDEMYLQLLERYGVFEIITIAKGDSEETFDLFAKEYKLIDKLGDACVNGKNVAQYRCFIGSSQYNTKQMSRLLKGVISECQELNIPTDPKDDVDKAIKEWNSV